MSKIKLPTIDPTLAAADAALAARSNTQTPREYLGMSQIGHECDRNLFYSFRLSFVMDFDAKTVRRFQDGHYSESVMATRLRDVPNVQLHTVDPDTGEQIRFTDHGGHFSGHADGMIRGLLQAPSHWHVWEHKCVGDDMFAGLKLLKEKSPDEKDVLSNWNATYYAQAVLYMDYANIDRHYMTIDLSGSRETISIRTAADPQFAEKLRQRALKIIKLNEPPPRISEDPTFWKCRMCPAIDVCHGYKMPAVNCRTCTHSTPDVEKGGWFCERHKMKLSFDVQRIGCDDHTYLPSLLQVYGIEPIDSNGESVIYLTKGMNKITIGPGGGDAMPSIKAQHITPVLADELINAARKLGGEIVDPTAGPPPGTVEYSAEQIIGLVRMEAYAKLDAKTKTAIARGEATFLMEGNTFVARNKKGEVLT
jgi:hypothetical protein